MTPFHSYFTHVSPSAGEVLQPPERERRGRCLQERVVIRKADAGTSRTAGGRPRRKLVGDREDVARGSDKLVWRSARAGPQKRGGKNSPGTGNNRCQQEGKRGARDGGERTRLDFQSHCCDRHSMNSWLVTDQLIWSK